MRKSKAELEFLSLLEQFFTDYLPNLAYASKNTIVSYKCAFRLLLQFCAQMSKSNSKGITFEMLNYDLLSQFVDWLQNVRGNSRTTVKQRIGALSSFAEYAQNRSLEAGYVFSSSLSKISKKSFRRVKSKQRFAFTRQELEIFFSLPDTSNPIGWRDFVLLVVMYASGARAQEICDLSVRDVSYENEGRALLTLMGKGTKPRRVKLTNEASQILKKYIACRKIDNQPERHVFSSQRNEQMSVACVEEIFEKYEKQAKQAHPDKFCAGRYTPHIMRHTTATHLIEAGVPLPMVKNMLGHASIQSTQIYVEITQQSIDRYIKTWNDKWFPDDGRNKNVLPDAQNTLPEFLR